MICLDCERAAFDETVLEASVEATKHRNCLMNSRFGSVPVLVHREKPTKDAYEDISGGKSTKVPHEISEVNRLKGQN